MTGSAEAISHVRLCIYDFAETLLFLTRETFQHVYSSPQSETGLFITLPDGRFLNIPLTVYPPTQEPPKNKPMVVKEVKSIVNIGGAEVRSKIVHWRAPPTDSLGFLPCPPDSW